MADAAAHNIDYCIFEYQYRDAGNWKTFGELLLSGACAPDVEARMRRQFESGDLFVAEQIEVAPLCPEHFETYGGPSDLDHAYHEFVALRPATRDEARAMRLFSSLDALLHRIEATQGVWDVRLSPNCDA